MQQLILDLSGFSRVNMTRQALKPADVADTLATTERQFDIPLRETGATIIHGPMSVVMADSIQLGPALANLVSNATKSCQPGVPRFTRIGARETGDAADLGHGQRDRGAAPRPDHRYVRHLHTHDRHLGTGTRSSRKKDRRTPGRTIRVEPTPGRGATLYFTLPAA